MCACEGSTTTRRVTTASAFSVDRRWPRGLSKARAELDEWCTQVAPSDALRKWTDTTREVRGVRLSLPDRDPRARAGRRATTRSLLLHGPLTSMTRPCCSPPTASRSTYLIARGTRAEHPSGGIGLQYLISAVDSDAELRTLAQALQGRVGRTDSYTSEACPSGQATTRTASGSS